MPENLNPPKVRLDKWLWAARFYKTRKLAQDAIAGGKVHYEGARSKASQWVQVGSEIRVTQGFDKKTVTVSELSDKRGGAKQAALLYEETPESLAAREEAKQKRLLATQLVSKDKPGKHGRQAIRKFKGKA